MAITHAKTVPGKILAPVRIYRSLRFLQHSLHRNVIKVDLCNITGV